VTRIEPFIENEDAGSQADRRLILVSYHFPPDRAVGARRWEKFSHFAAERGWGLDVFMCGDVQSLDADAARRLLPSGVRVYAVPAQTLRVERAENAVWRALKRRRSPATEAAVTATASAARAPAQRVASRVASVARSDVRWGLGTPRGWMRAYWAALDFARIGAWGGAVFEGVSTIFDSKVHRAVITSGPPFMSHDVGRSISQRFRIPFIMDMRDPWSHVERLAEGIATPAWTRLAARYESLAVDRASLVVTNTEVARQQMAATYPLRARDVITVTNGADDDVLPPQRRGGRFVIAHAGTLYLDRDPRALFQAAARVIRELSLTPEDMTLEFIGELEAVGGFPIEQVARAEGISEYVRTGPLRPYGEAMAFMADATMLVTMSGSSIAAIPAKTFECVRFPAWILALSAPDSATAVLLRDTGADIASPGDVTGIAEIIGRRYREHRAGVFPQPVGREPRFSRRYQAGLLLDALEARVAGGR
jgi:glycosyltransferase involved in cell wall biosynthesis